MEHNRFLTAVLAMLFLLLTTTVAAAARFDEAPGRSAAVATWQQANTDGFGDAQNSEVSAVAAFDGYLYAGTANATAGAGMLRSADGTTWTPVIDPGFGNPHDTAPPAILDLAVFGGRLYAGTGRGNAAQIWRSANGLNWAPVVSAGFGDPDIVAIRALVEYGGKIYAGVTKQDSGAQIWSSFTGDSNTWSKETPATGGTATAGVTGFALFDGGLLAAIQSENDTPVQIWRSDGGAWSTIVADGFGDSNTLTSGGMAVFAGALYVGAGNTTAGAQLWRTSDGTTWTQVITPAFGDANNAQVELVAVYQDRLYISTANAVTGMEIWRSADGTTWEQASPDGFGEANNDVTNESNAAGEYAGGLFVGTANSNTGGELWQLPCAAADANATVSNGQIHFSWIGEATNIYRLPNAPYATEGSAIATGQAPPFAYSELLLGNVSSNAFYLVGPSPSCGDRLGEFDFALVPGKP